ncbi:unnamed protein product [Arctogadus glacialis]
MFILMRLDEEEDEDEEEEEEEEKEEEVMLAVCGRARHPHLAIGGTNSDRHAAMNAGRGRGSGKRSSRRTIICERSVMSEVSF